MKFPTKYLDRSRSTTTFIKTSLLLAIFGYLVASSNLKVIAQIVPDRTLANNSVVNDHNNTQTMLFLIMPLTYKILLLESLEVIYLISEVNKFSIPDR